MNRNDRKLMSELIVILMFVRNDFSLVYSFYCIMSCYKFSSCVYSLDSKCICSRRETYCKGF